MTVFLVILIVLLAIPGLMFGLDAFRIVLCLLVGIAAVVHLIVLVRTKNPIYLVTMLFYLFTILTFATRSHHLTVPYLIVITGVLFAGFMYVLLTNRIKWRYDEILELIARPVDESEDGFTTRPYPAGRTCHSEEEVKGFAQFMLRHVIAYPFFEEDRIVLVIPSNMFTYLLFLKRDYSKDTYVSIGYDGAVSVNIRRKDYQKYHEELTFDRLCQSLGDLFKSFLAMHSRGEKKEIIQRLNRL
jgi:Ca2+/Na+ antiporter